MTKTNTRKSATANKAASAKRAAKAPGNAKALHDKANDNLAKLARNKGKVEVISTVVSLKGSKTGGMLVTTSRDRNIQVNRVDKTVLLLAVKGEPADLLDRYLKVQPAPKAELARGVDAKSAPHSAKAVRDQAANAKSAKPSPKGKAAAKAPKATKAKAGGDYSYKPTKKPNEAKPDSLRGRMLSIILANTDTASAKAAATKAKLTGLNSGWFNWAAANGYITK